MTQFVVGVLLGSCMIGEGPTNEKPATNSIVEIDARHWFNNPVFRLRDDRKVILFFFKCDSKEGAKWAARLNRMTRRPDLVIIGLTDDSQSQAERFIKRRNPRFTIGAGSRTAKRLGIREMPALRVIEGKDRARVRVAESIQVLVTMLPDWQQSVSDIETASDLMDFVSSDALGRNREAAIRKLFEMLPPERRGELVALAESQLPIEPDPFVRGTLRLYRDLALGVRQTAWEQSASNAYSRDFRRDPHDAEWVAAHAFMSEKLDLPAPRLLGEFRTHQSNDPNDIVIRRLIVERLDDRGAAAEREDPYRAGARTALMEILPEEPDRSIRLAATSALARVCEFGDKEVIEFLEALAPSEPNDQLVRPMMEYVAYRLRTGIVETRFFEPPE